MRDTTAETLAPGFIGCLVWITILGAASLLLGNVIGSIVVPGHDFVADTVSDLAAGKYEIIQDVALYGFAAALMALALGAATLHSGETRWSLLIGALALLAACVVIIGARNEYGDNDNDGVVIHIYVVYGIGALFAGCFLIGGLAGGRIAGFLPAVSWGCLVLWAVGAPVFFFLPTEWDGLWERGLGVICVVWVVSFAWAMRQHCHRTHDPSGATSSLQTG